MDKRKLIIMLLIILISGCLENEGDIILSKEEKRFIGVWISMDNSSIFNLTEDYRGIHIENGIPDKFDEWREANGDIYFFYPNPRNQIHYKYNFINNNTVILGNVTYRK